MKADMQYIAEQLQARGMRLTAGDEIGRAVSVNVGRANEAETRLVWAADVPADNPAALPGLPETWAVAAAAKAGRPLCRADLRE